MLIVHSIDNDYFIEQSQLVHLVRLRINFLIKKLSIQILTNLFVRLALPEPSRIEHRDLSHSRRPAQEVKYDLWREPDTKPVFTFMLRPRLIQEGIGCKLICCVSGKPPPKVGHS
jgi:hypothetical protein